MKTNNNMQGGAMNYKTPISLLLSVIVWCAFLSAPAPAHGAAGEGKFHLVYRVIAQKMEKGTLVEVEPGFLTDGDRIVFAYDYCRHHFPSQNHRADYGIQEARVDRKFVSAEDQFDLGQYCKRVPFTLKGENYSVLDNTGTRLTLANITYTSPVQGQSEPVIRERLTATLVRFTGSPLEKRPAALRENQPYIFLMSRNRSLLERIMPAAEANQSEVAALVAMHERYMKNRQATDPKASQEQCESYSPVSAKDAWRGLTSLSPSIAEVFYSDIDGDGKIDMLVRLLEPSKPYDAKGMPEVKRMVSLAMLRAYYGNGNERCVLRNEVSRVLSPIYVPITVIKIRACVYAFTQFDAQESNPSQDLIRLGGMPPSCPSAHSIRWHEKL